MRALDGRVEIAFAAEAVAVSRRGPMIVLVVARGPEVRFSVTAMDRAGKGA
ncbi:hypothetical protein J4G48_0003470 [Bradyrhizobium barranii subsp. apii]|uniref:hypothetical protein n=1 Tax=Bradyrhizobium barranii TaxID=2992140 RepID=UPI001AA1C436|nr:hypothetical protein [Bradyrhizobium barranii]UPT97255.1 hypothetical protein J4G48_0003470 [Bradyrhizobium barranii subsp. apii]